MNEVEEYRNKLGAGMNVRNVKKGEDFKKFSRIFVGKLLGLKRN